MSSRASSSAQVLCARSLFEFRCAHPLSKVSVRFVSASFFVQVLFASSLRKCLHEFSEQVLGETSAQLCDALGEPIATVYRPPTHKHTQNGQIAKGVQREQKQQKAEIWRSLRGDARAWRIDYLPNIWKAGILVYLSGPSCHVLWLTKPPEAVLLATDIARVSEIDCSDGHCSKSVSGAAKFTTGTDSEAFG